MAIEASLTTPAHAAAANTSASRPSVPERLATVQAALTCGVLAALAQAAVVAPFLGRYGWDRDELYFMSASRRPTWGYVDFPPLTAWIGWVIRTMFGESLIALRLTCLTAMMATVVLVALTARELGGSRSAQLAAALVWALSPYALGAGSLFHPTWLDALCWVALLYTLTLALGRDRPRLWLVAGAIAGIGLEAKYTIAVLLVALLASLLATSSRRILRSRWPWLGLAVALLLFLPNLVWQAQHSWPSLHFAASQNAKTATDTSPTTYLDEQLFLGAGLVLAAIGVVVLWRRKRLRPLALVAPLVTALFLLERGRAYYPLPADAIAVAAGVVGLTTWLRGRRRRLLALAPLLTLHAAALAFALPIILPLRGTTSMISSGLWKQSFYKDEIGWPELTDQTALAWHSLPAGQRRRGVILARNYGEASALEFYGPTRGLPPVLSGHLSWQYWRPHTLLQRFALLVGFDPADVHELCSSTRTLAVIDNRFHLDNEERGRLIVTCRLRAPLGTLWQRDIATTTL